MNKRYGMAINIARCFACLACVMACKQEYKLPTGVRRIRINKMGPKGIFPKIEQHYLPVLCMQCEKASCIEACPIDGALYRKENGIVLVNEQKCDGCEACLYACPYKALSLDPSRKVAVKCDFCIKRLEKGLKPSCVLVCPTKAITFDNLNDISSDISILLQQKKCSALLPQRDMGPAIYYQNLPDDDKRLEEIP